MVVVPEEQMSAKKQPRNSHLYFSWRILKINILYLFVLSSALSFGQTDTSAYSSFKNKLIVYADVGYTTAPFSIHYNYSPAVDNLKYRNNFRTVLGLGVSYKWFSLRLGIPLPGNVRPISRFGRTTHYDLGFDFTIKKTFCDIDIRNYKGYAIKNANSWNDTLNELKPNDIRPSTNAVSFSANVWYFHDHNFKMTALKGKTAHYNREVRTWYIKSSLNVFGVGNGNESMVPTELVDPLNSKTGSSSITSIDLGVIPGYAYVNKINNWQFSVIGGIGAALQGKFYTVENTSRGFLGLAPRYDIKLIAGYSVPKYFVFLVTDFDNKTIRFSDFIYRQSFYSIKLVGGWRFDVKEKQGAKKQP
jgi:hypothetical protein